MPIFANQVDQERGVDLWTQHEVDLYNQLPIYLAKTQIEYIKLYQRWPKLLKKWNWTPNQGHTARGVRKERSPIIRSQALPRTIQQMPTKDVIGVNEVTEDAQLYRKDFDSRIFSFLPVFADFLSNHVDATLEDMQEKIMVYLDLFYRTAIFHGSPSVWVCGKSSELTATNHWDSPTIALSKSAAELQALINESEGFLTLEAIKKLGVVMYNDIAATPFQGDVTPDGANGAALQQKYALVCGMEVWNGFTDAVTGNYLLNNKALDLDIVTGPFRGSLFGQWTTMLERFELRIAADGTIPAPETVEGNPTAYNYGETIMNPAYVDAPWGVAFGVGAESYKAVSIGPPPGMFSGGSLTMEKFNGMNWNGKVHITRNVLVPTVNEAGGITWDTNARGEALKLIADLVMGIMPIRRRNIVPIIYKRHRPGTGA